MVNYYQITKTLGMKICWSAELLDCRYSVHMSQLVQQDAPNAGRDGKQGSIKKSTLILVKTGKGRNTYIYYDKRRPDTGSKHVYRAGWLHKGQQLGDWNETQGAGSQEPETRPGPEHTQGNTEHYGQGKLKIQKSMAMTLTK